MIFEKVMTVVPDGEASSRSPDAGRSDRSDMPVLPARAKKIRMSARGEQPEPEDDERLHRERPPHWDSL